MATRRSSGVEEDLSADTGGEVLVDGVDAGVVSVAGDGRNTLIITTTRTASLDIVVL